MIILGAGMPKSGSGWFWNLANDMLVAAGRDDARTIRDKYGLHGWLKAKNCNLAQLEDDHLKKLAEYSAKGHTFIVKTHRGPNQTLRDLVADGTFRVCYTFRDLRDVIVSAMDRGEEMREKGETKGRHFFGIGPYKSFAKLSNVDWSVIWVKYRVMPVWRAYNAWDAALKVRYEDLIDDAVAQMRRVQKHLGFELPDAKLEEIAARYRRDKAKKMQGQGLHFNKGVTGRWREALSESDQRKVNRRLAGQLRLMGYEVAA